MESIARPEMKSSSEEERLKRDFGSEVDSVRRSDVMVEANDLLSYRNKTEAALSKPRNLFYPLLSTSTTKNAGNNDDIVAVDRTVLKRTPIRKEDELSPTPTPISSPSPKQNMTRSPRDANIFRSPLAADFELSPRLPLLNRAGEVVSSPSKTQKLPKLIRFEDTTAQQLLPKLCKIEDQAQSIPKLPGLNSIRDAEAYGPRLPKLIRLDDSQARSSPLPKLIRLSDDDIVIPSTSKSPKSNQVKVEKKDNLLKLPKLLRIIEDSDSQIPVIEIDDSDSDSSENEEEIEESPKKKIRPNNQLLSKSVVKKSDFKKSQMTKKNGKDEDHEEVELVSDDDVETLDIRHLAPKEKVGVKTTDIQLIEIDDDDDDGDDQDDTSDSDEDDSLFVDASDSITRADGAIDVYEPHGVDGGETNNVNHNTNGDTRQLSDNKEEYEEQLEKRNESDDEDDEDDEDGYKKRKGSKIPSSEVLALRAKLYAKLTGRSTEGPYGLDDKIDEIYRLISETLIHKGKNSSFIFGPRSSGKTSAFRKALSRARKELHPHEDFIQIRISGLAQDDDKLAVRAIAEQLDAEISRIYNIDVRDLEASELLNRKSLSLTMANILKILDTEVNFNDGTVGKIENPIIFIVDDVDVYSDQSRQTLLYNLFDLVENSRTPISILCFTSKFTVKESLEKRVRSRFSQRSIVFEKFGKEKFLEVASKIISVDTPKNDYEIKFNQHVEELLSKSSSLRKLIVFNHLTTANLKEFQNHCVLAVSKLSQDQPFFNDEDFEAYTQNVSKGSLRNIINSLSDLETFLLVSAARVIAKRDLNWCNLNLVHEEYESQIKTRSAETSSSTAGLEAVTSTGYKIWSKDSCKHPWETLQNIGLLTTPTSADGKSRSQDYSNSTFETKMWHVELTLDELRLVIDAEKPVKPWTRL